MKSGFIAHVLVAVDLYGESAMPVERAAQLACAAGARLQILYVASPRVQQSTTARLHAVAAGVRSRYGVSAEVDVAAGRPPSAIASRAADAGADLVVLGAHRRSLMRDMPPPIPVNIPSSAAIGGSRPYANAFCAPDTANIARPAASKSCTGLCNRSMTVSR